MVLAGSPRSRLLRRAVILYALVRTIIGALAGAAARAGEAVTAEHPVGIVILVALLGQIDVRRRGERLLWANLGVGLTDVALLFAAVAVAGEWFVRVMR